MQSDEYVCKCRSQDYDEKSKDIVAVDMNNFLLEQQLTEPQVDLSPTVPEVKPSFEGLGLGISAETALTDLSERIEGYLERLVDDHTQTLTHSLTNFEEKTALILVVTKIRLKI